LQQKSSRQNGHSFSSSIGSLHVLISGCLWYFPTFFSGNVHIHTLGTYQFIIIIILLSGFMQQAFAAKGDQCKANKDCGRFCSHRPGCPTLCIGGYCLCNCDLTKMDVPHNKPF